MVRLSVLASLLLSLVIPCNATSSPLAKEAEVNGVRIQYLEDGSGEPVVFVHGAISDHRAWEPVRDEIARKYRFIALTQRYFGTGPWKDDGREFSVATFADISPSSSRHSMRDPFTSSAGLLVAMWPRPWQ
jgi:pimeloyl-ACP methyl ester carboxylesterase